MTGSDKIAVPSNAAASPSVGSENSLGKLGIAQLNQSERSAPVPSSQLDALLRLYRPKKRIKKEDKLLIKTILAFWAGYDGKVAKCEIHQAKFGENIPIPIEQLELHHAKVLPDGTYDSSNHELKYLFIGHGPCNDSLNARRRFIKEGPSYPSVCEINKAAPLTAMAEEQAKRGAPELDKHNRQRFLWNVWINDAKQGAFSVVKEWYASTLAKKAVHALGTGSSVTYRRWIDEDVDGGVLSSDTDEQNRLYVKYSGKESFYKYHLGKKMGPPAIDSVQYALEFLEKRDAEQREGD